MRGAEKRGAEKSFLEIWTERLTQSLEQAHEALAAGDPAGAERAGKAVSALVKAIQDVGRLEEAARNQRPEEDDADLRAELERRIARFIEADRAEDLAGVLEDR